MASLRALVVLSLGVASTLAQRNPNPTGPPTQEDMDEQNRNASCANNCLFAAWPEGYCVEDPACQCNNQDKREAYLCCVAKECVTDFWKHALELTSDNCDAFGIPFTFDLEGACGIKETSSSQAAVETKASTVTSAATQTATKTIATESADATSSSEESAETTSEPSETEQGAEAPSETPGAAPAFGRGMGSAMGVAALSGWFLF
ncbi:uncharacterized protein F5Z01DRAFT_633391 [Emericellopsis atlantica]|uniref:Extracellular membrane protein CFEM domain-containing protein n=1 Tax=Emericellopsis atlantica TaxID=2614577 RepID=A0A9P7ZSD3_9HYPO|nr:uncharacterized protein F5Z01DRAFT_633391 [Emericellopsis atlantica]KAG9257449.1 hypothetical protein F5Z01DRAFT_633391 [Emericellopsis atlantica]